MSTEATLGDSSYLSKLLWIELPIPMLVGGTRKSVLAQEDTTSYFDPPTNVSRGSYDPKSYKLYGRQAMQAITLYEQHDYGNSLEIMIIPVTRNLNVHETKEYLRFIKKLSSDLQLPHQLGYLLSQGFHLAFAFIQ